MIVKRTKEDEIEEIRNLKKGQVIGPDMELKYRAPYIMINTIESTKDSPTYDKITVIELRDFIVEV